MRTTIAMGVWALCGTAVAQAAPPTVGRVEFTHANTSMALSVPITAGGLETTVWLRTAPNRLSACDDVAGQRVPATGGIAAGSGTASVLVGASIEGLSPNSHHEVCVLAENADGLTAGSIASFTTSDRPEVSMLPPGNVGGTTAIVRASSIGHNATTTVRFRYAGGWWPSCDALPGSPVPVDGLFGGFGLSAEYVQFELKGLQLNTEYSLCAVATNAYGTVSSEVATVLTMGIPAVTTLAVADLEEASGTLRATVNPLGGQTQAWFFLDTEPPVDCGPLSVHQLRIPEEGGTVFNSQRTPQTLSTPVQLARRTRYYVCAAASNAAGYGAGEVLSFVTVAPPDVGEVEAVAVSAWEATLVGVVNANESPTTAWFRYDTRSPGACNTSFGRQAPSGSSIAVGDGAEDAIVQQVLTSLRPATTYHACLIAQNAEGVTFGDLMTFTTPADRPTVTTLAAADVDVTSAHLAGLIAPNGAATTAWFRWVEGPMAACDDSVGTRVPASGGWDVGAGPGVVGIEEALVGLVPNVEHSYCAIAENAVGRTYGAVQVFEPGVDPPIVSTERAYTTEPDMWVLTGLVNPLGVEAEGWFRYGTSDPPVCDDSFGLRAPAVGGVAIGAVNASVPFEETAPDLLPDATYFYCAAASSLGGSSFGDVMTWHTEPVPPTVSTVGMVSSLGEPVRLGSVVNPNGTASTSWFRVGEVPVEACSDAWGTRWPASGDVELGSGREDVAWEQAVSGLGEGTWYVCAMASSRGGTAAGEVVAFEVIEPVDDTDDTDAIDSDVGDDEDGDMPPCGCQQSTPSSGLALLGLTWVFRRRPARRGAPSLRAG